MDEPPDHNVSPLAPPADDEPITTRPGLESRGRRSMAPHARRARLALTTLVLIAALACLLGQVVPDAW